VKKRRLSLLLSLFLLAGCAPETPAPTPLPTPAVVTEMRGVWLSYLELDAILQGDAATVRDRLDRVMDTCVAQGINTVFYHARAHGDAYYPSAVYPAADALVGVALDPLAYAIEAAHRREIALHAWVNPYRLGNAPPADTTGAFVHEAVWYHDPSSEHARQLVLAGVRELLERYPVDGIHFDDYFYPSGLGATPQPFETVPEGSDVAVWRTQQVNGLVSAVWGLCRREGRVFGISPPGTAAQCRAVYADVDTWLRTPGYVDYLCPQLYTGFDHSTAPFDALLAQWGALPRHREVTLYVGLALYKAGLANDPYAGAGAGEWAASHDILARQVIALRQQEGGAGFVLFRYDYLCREETAREREALQALM